MWGPRFAENLIKEKTTFQNNSKLLSGSSFAAAKAEGPKYIADNSDSVLGNSWGPVLGVFPPWVSKGFP